jgi:replicative DNA helicase
MAERALVVPPHSEEAERSVLGSLLLDGQSLVKIGDFLKSDDFYFDRYKLIYEACLDLFNGHIPIDLLTLGNKLSESGKLEKIGGSVLLAELANDVPSASHIFDYANIVKSKSTLRRLIHAGDYIKGLGFKEGEDLTELLGDAEKQLFGVTQTFVKDHFVHVRDILESRYEDFAELHEAEDKDAMRGVPSGYKALDNILSGMKPSDLIILAARPAMGKTSFALSIALNAALKFKKTVGIFSLEMSKEQLVDRMFCSMLMVDSWKLHKGRLDDADFARIGGVMDDLSKANIFIDDSLGGSLTELRSKVRRLKMENGLDMIVIDYLQLMTSGTYSGNRVQEISDISRALKALGREMHVPVLALSQLSRAVESRPDKQPQLSDLRESGAIEQDADVVMMLYREDYYDPDTDRQGITDVLIRKHRNGPIGKVELMFKKEQMRFFDIEKARGFGGQVSSAVHDDVLQPVAVNF